jgi:hypothetical protein
MKHSYVVSMRWMVIYEYKVPGEALNLNYTNYPGHGHRGDLPLQGKNLLAEPGSNPAPHDLVVRNTDH